MAASPLIAIYARLIRIPLVGPLFRLPVLIVRSVTGGAGVGPIPSGRGRLGLEMLAAGLDALGADIKRQGQLIESLIEENERLRLKVAMLTGRLEAETAQRMAEAKAHGAAPGLIALAAPERRSVS